MDRREFLGVAGAAAGGSLLLKNVMGANDRVGMGFIGVGVMGTGNLSAAIAAGAEPVVLCDVYQPNLEKAVAVATQAGKQVKAVKDFREVIADPSIDAVCISTPDHWHAYMMVEAAKAKKDIYVEKPVSTTVDEARKMLDAARKYSRVVQVGTARRSWNHVKRALELVQGGALGQVSFTRAWVYGLEPPECIGNPPDGDPPAGLDWDMWLGPAPRRPYNPNRFGVLPGRMWASFRYFWDYAGGQMTDNVIHMHDLVHMLTGEPMPKAATGFGTKYYLKDNRETPDTGMVTIEYPNFISALEFRYGNAQALLRDSAAPTMAMSIHGDKGTLELDQSGFQLIPEDKPVSFLFRDSFDRMVRGERPPEVVVTRGNGSGPTPDYEAHWRNFLDCIKSRQKPIGDLELVARSSISCLLGNVAMRARTRVDYDAATGNVLQKGALPFMSRAYRTPWKLAV
jgi:predicted dehydrogenase